MCTNGLSENAPASPDATVDFPTGSTAPRIRWVARFATTGIRESRLLTALALLCSLAGAFAVGDRLDVSALARMRFRLIGAPGDSIDGISGERLKTGFDFRSRLELGATFRATERLKLGTALRVSNEDADATLFPPDLVSGRLAGGWWWARFEQGIADITAGAFDASFTPLTLMRWDLDDNPLGSGSSCCAVAVGGLRGNSLEDFSADYRLEGTRLVLAPGPLHATLLLARTALPSAGRSYAQYLGGVRLRYEPLVPWLTSTACFGITGLRVTDDKGSVGQAANPPLRSDVASFDLSLPVLEPVAVVAEVAYSMRDDNLALADPELSDAGMSTGLRLGDRENLDLQMHYLRFEPNFLPLYRALTVGRNRQGLRFFAARRNIAFGRVTASASGYVKFLRELVPMVGTEFTGGKYPGDFRVVTMSIRCEPWYGTSLGVDGEWRRNTRTDDPATLQADERLDATEVIGSLLLVRRLTLQNSVQLKYSLVRHRDPAAAYTAHLPGLELNLKI